MSVVLLFLCGVDLFKNGLTFLVFPGLPSLPRLPLLEMGLFWPRQNQPWNVLAKIWPGAHPYHPPYIPFQTVYHLSSTNHHPPSTMETKKWMRRSGRTRFLPTILPSNPANSIQHYFMFLHSGEQFLLIFLLNPGTLCSPWRVCESSFVASSRLLDDSRHISLGTARAGRLTSGVLSPSVRTSGQHPDPDPDPDSTTAVLALE
jgi:hypothetical protein